MTDVLRYSFPIVPASAAKVASALTVAAEIGLGTNDDGNKVDSWEKDDSWLRIPSSIVSASNDIDPIVVKDEEPMSMPSCSDVGDAMSISSSRYINGEVGGEMSNEGIACCDSSDSPVVTVGSCPATGPVLSAPTPS